MINDLYKVNISATISKQLLTLWNAILFDSCGNYSYLRIRMLPITGAKEKDMKEKFCEMLRSTKRDGVETVISNLEKLGFFKAPASTVFHLNKEGGLVEHSVNVCEMALMLRESMIAKMPALAERLTEDSVKVVALLHDVCKSEIYKLGFRNAKNETTGVWEKVPRYEVDYSYCPLGHGEKSVIRLMGWGFKLSLDEILAIRWHMSAWDLPFQSAEMKSNIGAARDKCPLVTILQCADGLASGIIEAPSSI